MTFICKKTIYEQVYDHFCEDIIKGTYKGVSPKTQLQAYTLKHTIS